ncbi:DUF6708 domain-containing protein [Aquabacterium sp.]|uniref:DUF6708 domain-containing protein n=1 Tax=Aquabacterium sp. TaxID=1872578 RepID=UPI0024872148|nr:DUF6708 domain-containing protein [Aquabacterium sp.]MDI1258276.1 hypothetical protein [Aquabacterium sp.]
MEYSGLTIKYPVNRPLTDLDRERQLHQKRKLEVPLIYQLGVIQVDEAGLELVDKYYALKGAMTTVMLVPVAMVLLFLGAVTGFSLTTPGRMVQDWPVLLAMYGMLAPVLWVMNWGFRKESFAYTHYPIRLDRITRMVHVFRLNGTVLSVPWDDIFFCTDTGQGGAWNIRGHVLAEDRVTVLETFALSPTAGKTAHHIMLSFWEMVRGYMEDGPQAAIALAQVLLPIEKERESFAFGFHRMHAVASGESTPLVLVWGFISAVFAPGRWLAMRTSKIPQWPAEVAATFGKAGTPERCPPAAVGKSGERSPLRT